MCLYMEGLPPPLVLPSEGKGGITESMAKFEHRNTGVELVGAAGRVPHVHVEEGELVHIVSWVLCGGEQWTVTVLHV